MRHPSPVCLRNPSACPFQRHSTTLPACLFVQCRSSAVFLNTTEQVRDPTTTSDPVPPKLTPPSPTQHRSYRVPSSILCRRAVLTTLCPPASAEESTPHIPIYFLKTWNSEIQTPSNPQSTDPVSFPPVTLKPPSRPQYSKSLSSCFLARTRDTDPLLSTLGLRAQASFQDHRVIFLPLTQPGPSSSFAPSSSVKACAVLAS